MAFPSSSQLATAFTAYKNTVATLAAKKLITASDLASLDRLGRCMVASHHFDLCDHQAREALLHDDHQHTRSKAIVALQSARVRFGRKPSDYHAERAAHR